MLYSRTRRPHLTVLIQECDDGNSNDGDYCNNNCKLGVQGGTGGHTASQVQTLSISTSASTQYRGAGTGKPYPLNVFESGIKKAALRNLAAKIIQPTYMTGSGVYDGHPKWAQNQGGSKAGLEYTRLVEADLLFTSGLMGWEMQTVMQNYYPWFSATYSQTWRWGYRISRGSSTRPLSPVSGCSATGGNTPQSGWLAYNSVKQSCYEYNVLSNCVNNNDCGFHWNIHEQMCVCQDWGLLVPWNQCPTSKSGYSCYFG